MLELHEKLADTESGSKFHFGLTLLKCLDYVLQQNFKSAAAATFEFDGTRGEASLNPRSRDSAKKIK